MREDKKDIKEEETGKREKMAKEREGEKRGERQDERRSKTTRTGCD